METVAVQSTLGNHPVVFGVFRDGDNNLDDVQERNVTDFIKTTGANPSLKVIAEDTTSLPRAPFRAGDLRTETSVIEDGQQHFVKVQRPLDMSDRATLADFVRRTLETRYADSKFSKSDVWIDLVDHGGGDGGGLESQSSGGFMSIEDIAGAISDGRAAFRKAHPGADDSITGVAANQCLMASCGFADALSRSGVKYLAASPETMLAPGVPSAKVADILTEGASDWPQQIVDATMKMRYGMPPYHPAAAFDVLDLDPRKIAAVRSAVGDFNDAVVGLRSSADGADAIRDLRADIRSVRGMVRFDHSADMPWHTDRPAEAVYDAIASDGRLPDGVRSAARHASGAISDLILAHAESDDFGPFHASYSDAAGPTEHLPLTKRAYDPWVDGGVVETHNGFFDAVHGREFERAIGAYNARQDASGAAA